MANTKKTEVVEGTMYEVVFGDDNDCETRCVYVVATDAVEAIKIAAKVDLECSDDLRVTSLEEHTCPVWFSQKAAA